MTKLVPFSLVVVLGSVAGMSSALADQMVFSPMPIQPTAGVTSHGGAALAGPPMMAPMPRPMPRPMGYPQMHAPMYPSPVPNVPVQVGGTTYTNQAFAPHEMLYAHKYRALYPPFYYKVSGRWWWTPFGMESHDRWELQGTKVSVNYRTSYAPFSGFFPPVHR